ncbi:hypothetical protein BO99DRAFT_109606 [Aspergillus violaceofuscus CBS 115571]|uniref:Uncharacterized protein n=1 Tax=Aspergillus violaceofuscus (strain CBS 115571) TaxID=1450538 RepID=A0A2V5HAJ5_ASPV1|nr:hypothetical protein BO99DRAFT_109606 [Aspergillus violaceofuscus CBS 115571]
MVGLHPHKLSPFSAQSTGGENQQKRNEKHAERARTTLTLSAYSPTSSNNVHDKLRFGPDASRGNSCPTGRLGLRKQQYPSVTQVLGPTRVGAARHRNRGNLEQVFQSKKPWIHHKRHAMLREKKGPRKRREE